MSRRLSRGILCDNGPDILHLVGNLVPYLTRYIRGKRSTIMCKIKVLRKTMQWQGEVEIAQCNGHDIMISLVTHRSHDHSFLSTGRMPFAKTDDKIVLKHAKVCIGALSLSERD